MSGLRTRIDSIEPERVTLTQHGAARIRVSGRALGILRCAGQTRVVWGVFDESFVVAAGSHGVLALGLGGAASGTVAVASTPDLHPPRAVRIARLDLRPVQVPRLRPLTRSDLERAAASSDTTSGSSAPGSSPS